eukprot:CAMPEP_0118662786 /NCGR_PEP_ID=MMETSP0785-20121206/17028_1 /TAXON_ID=91992 /ORGANISM="Bolidomonas pacifica, Strain CCMP 1866" /LENGTH=164 /DNA_ID=CAMNT_0006556375 /DNA_START=108 /DNA_END=598 /DNA_ORIENTATION=+
MNWPSKGKKQTPSKPAEASIVEGSSKTNKSVQESPLIESSIESSVESSIESSIEASIDWHKPNPYIDNPVYQTYILVRQKHNDLMYPSPTTSHPTIPLTPMSVLTLDPTLSIPYADPSHDLHNLLTPPTSGKGAPTLTRLDVTLESQVTGRTGSYLRGKSSSVG